MNLKQIFLFSFFLAVSFTSLSMPQKPDRSKIPDRYKWNLTDIYSSDEACKEAISKLRTEIPAIEKYKGTFGKSASQLLECLSLNTHLNIEYARLFSYVNLKLDQDMRDQSSLAMKQEIDQLGALFSEKGSFIQTEILTLDPATIQSYIRNEKNLEVYQMFLSETLRSKTHIGTEGEERILALSGIISDAASGIHDIFLNTEFQYPEITLSSGKKVKLDPSGFASNVRSLNRDDRQKVFTSYLSRFNEYSRTFGAQYNAQIQSDIFYMKAKKYNSCLEMSLNNDNIPSQAYYKLIENVNRNLGTLHRYLKLRQRILGVEQLHYYDLYAPVSVKADLKYSIEDAEKYIAAALKPLGNKYTSIIEKAFNERWIDFCPAEGKSEGGYSNGYAYGIHPYILFNYNGRYADMGGLAHELGHAMQSYFSNNNQSFETAFCPRSITEVASTFNEALLIDYMLKQINNDDARLSLLNSCLENIKTTVFRAAQISEFELRMHEMAEKEEQITGDVLNRVYADIAKKYYGHDKNVCIVDDEIKAEWMYIPQLYHPFYAYEYAASYTASAALSEMVLNGDYSTVQKYIEFISSGGSDYSINLLKKAGVDLNSPAPFELTMKKMNRLMDEMEKILDKKK
jgi:oligoendopeptidase F